MPERLFLQRQFLVFVAGGVLSALVDIGLMQLLLGAGAAPLAAASAGFVAGLMVNYAFHARVTFARLTQRHSLPRYLCVVALNYGITLLLVWLAQTLLGMPLAGKLASLPVVAANGFLLSKFWVFK
ncbi:MULTISPECIES: GtrA family protein [unclassified Duganella]|uniref:GtrA family protein n=1 Tax=unclassified Duganella TaxID=2636909 RepID=UPI000E354934|nr:MULTISPECIES: GtrA family protein [unclassified Duganella]RFP11908.1 GtrA family protein [Duganella sp. BJB475]RFP30082.1 GtrA family protein [Duganella sp. BJB476]